MGAHTHLLHHGHFGNVWRLWLAEACVVILAGFGLYCAILQWWHGEIDMGFWALGSLAGPAIVYGFGYSWCLPEVLGGTSHDPGRTSLQRWSDFALLSTFIALLVTWTGYGRAIWVNWSYVELARVLVILVTFSWVMPGCVVASEKYLGGTMPGGTTRPGAGWRARVRVVPRTWGNWLVRLLGVRRAMGIGGTLVLLSLILVVHGELSGLSTKGYAIVAGVRAWFSAGVGAWFSVTTFDEVPRAVYVLGVGIAALALAGLMPGRFGKKIRGSRMVAILAGVIALLQLTIAAVATPVSVVFDHRRMPLAFWLLIWVVPIAIWMLGARRHPEQRDRTRLAVMVFYLPIFLAGFADLVLITYFGAGLGVFVIGMLLVWWGLVQSQSAAKANG